MDKRKQHHIDLEERLIDFAVRILELVETLPKLSTAKHGWTTHAFRYFPSPELW